MRVHQYIGLPDSMETMAKHPERVEAVLMGTIHRSLAVVVVADDDDDDDDRIEITTACGLTGITEHWRMSGYDAPAVSGPWHTNERRYGVNPPCPRCAKAAP